MPIDDNTIGSESLFGTVCSRTPRTASLPRPRLRRRLRRCRDWESSLESIWYVSSLLAAGAGHSRHVTSPWGICSDACQPPQRRRTCRNDVRLPQGCAHTHENFLNFDHDYCAAQTVAAGHARSSHKLTASPESSAHCRRDSSVSRPRVRKESLPNTWGHRGGWQWSVFGL